MLQLLPKNDIIAPNTTNPQKAIEYISAYIEKHQCKNMSVDISFMNVLDACHVSTMCSTKHYIKYPDGKINWKISSDIIKEFNKNMELGNSSYI